MLRAASSTLATRRNGSAQNLPGLLAGVKPSKGKLVPLANPAWSALINSHWHQYLAMVLGYLVCLYSDRATPFRRAIYHETDAELWRYSYPLLPNQVPAQAVVLLCFTAPFAVILPFYFAGRISRVVAHHGLLQAFAAVVITGLITNLIKLNVARPRPDFVARCWPNGAQRAFTDIGVPICAPDAIDWVEGLKSFPSGHTSWAASGMAYLTLWLLGALRVFGGAARPTSIAAALCPLCLAAWIGMTRIQDRWHHTEDVMVGFSLGSTIAYLCYRAVHCPVNGPHAGALTALAVPDEGAGAGPSISREPSFAQMAAAAGVGVPLQPVRYNPLVETTPEETV